MSKNIAVFDFDHTLILGDSFFPFLSYVCGKAKTYTALAEALALYGARHARREKIDTDMRTFLKAHLLKRTLANRRATDLVDAARKTRQWQKENPLLIRALRDHNAKGDHVVIASGGLDLYLPELLRDLSYDALICTDIGIENGIVTGLMTKGNCVRERKAERVKDYIVTHGPFDDSFGYGNFPHDLPMLNLLKHRVIVS